MTKSLDLCDAGWKVAFMQNNSFSIRPFGNRNVMAVAARSDRSFARHTHDEYGIGMVVAGAQRSWSGRGLVEGGAGDIITVNPGEVHDGAPIGECREWIMLYLSPEVMGDIVLDLREGASPRMEFADPVIHDRVIADRFFAAYTASPQHDGDAEFERLTLLIAAVLRPVPASHRTTAPPLACAKARIDDDPAGSHPLEELAKNAGISRFQTIRGFARLTGLTPHAYVVQRRLDLARSLIRQGTTLTDAAIKAGFSDQSHFHRAFTSRYGLTPRAYAIAVR